VRNCVLDPPTVPPMREAKTYLEALLADEDMAFNCSRPIPKPPTAPASSPSNTSTGILSRSDFFFPDFAIRFFSTRDLPSPIILAFTLPSPSRAETATS